LRTQLRKGASACAVAACVAGGVIAFPSPAGAVTPPTYTINRVGNYGGEPSITAADAGTTLSTPGELYEASLAGAKAFRSTSAGAAWTAGATSAFSNTGDDCLGTDQEGALYLCNLTITGPSIAPLQGDVYKSVDQGDHWTHSAGITFGNANTCGTSCSPFGVDRDWVDAYIPAGHTTSTAEVVLMYHDFYGPSHIWVNISTDGGTTFSSPSDVLTHLNPSAGAGGALALADTACSTVPSAVKIAKAGPHKGRIFVAWIAADPSSFLTGCNLSQAQAFHNLFIAYSDDNGSTWTPQLAYDAGLFHDSSTPFVGFTLDDQGNPYFGFAANNPSYSPAMCAVPNNPQTANCEYDMWVVWSKDGGSTWNGGGGLIPGSAATAYKVNSDVGTHWFPWIAAGDPGQVDVAYLETSHIIPTDANGKQHPGGCYPDPCTSTDLWYLWAGQSTDLLLGNGNNNPSPTWALTQITTSPMHQGDICNLGIACPPTANRHLADFIQNTIDPTTGCAHIAYADDKTTNEVDSANQVTGCFGTLGATIPEAPMTLLVIPAGLLAAGVLGYAARRRRRVVLPFQSD
jgi:hypothetical protein